MRSRFRMMFVATGCVLVAFVLFLASASSNLEAQGTTATPMMSGTVDLSAMMVGIEVPVNATNNSGAFLTFVNDIEIPGGTLVADVHANTGSDISFDTQAILGVSCANAFVYREMETGDLVAQPFTCTGDLLSVKGTGGNFNVDYLVASFPTAAAAQAAPLALIRSMEGTAQAVFSAATMPAATPMATP